MFSERHADKQGHLQFPVSLSQDTLIGLDAQPGFSYPEIMSTLNYCIYSHSTHIFFPKKYSKIWMHVLRKEADFLCWNRSMGEWKHEHPVLQWICCFSLPQQGPWAYTFHPLRCSWFGRTFVWAAKSYCQYGSSWRRVKSSIIFSESAIKLS